MDLSGKRILLSRTDSIGDVILTLPVAGILKELAPYCSIFFLGSGYTRAILQSCDHIDRFIDWGDINTNDINQSAGELRKLKIDVIIHVFPVKKIAVIAKMAGIPVRVGTTGRLFHLNNCNKLVRFSRRRSHVHEAQLNIKLLKPFGIQDYYSINNLIKYLGFKSQFTLNSALKSELSNDRINLIMHPKSRGSAREWGLGNFKELIKLLPTERFRIFITGTKEEGELLNSDGFFEGLNATNLTGKMSLEELISFISFSDGLVAASTGPLHIAAALGKYALGLFPPIRPMHPGRWAPLGEFSEYVVLDKKCSECRKSGLCHCMMEISPEIVAKKISGHFVL